MFIAQAYKAKNNAFWFYLIGSLIIFLGSIIGQIPFVIGVALEVGLEGMTTIDGNNLLSVLDPNLSFFLLLVSFVFAFAAIIFVVKILHGQKLLEVTTTRKKFDWGRAFFAFGLVAAFTIISTLIDYWLSPEDYVLNFRPIPFLILFILSLFLVPIQTSTEEYVFRGYLMQGLGILAKNRWFPLVITSVVFGGMHFFNPEVDKLGPIIMIYYIGTGFLLGIMTLMDEGMELALGFHAGNNMITALLVTADWTVFQTESIFKDVSNPEVGFDAVLPVFIVYPIFLIILAYKYKWKGWKEKLFGKVKPPETALIDEQVTV